LHGIERSRKLSGPPAPDQGISQVMVRYSDGRVLSFIPDAGCEVFNEDDLLELERVLMRASTTAEWAEVGEGSDTGG
jgi:hypothetical protein